MSNPEPPGGGQAAQESGPPDAGPGSSHLGGTGPRPVNAEVGQGFAWGRSAVQREGPGGQSPSRPARPGMRGGLRGAGTGLAARPATGRCWGRRLSEAAMRRLGVCAKEVGTWGHSGYRRSRVP